MAKPSIRICSPSMPLRAPVPYTGIVSIAERAQAAVPERYREPRSVTLADCYLAEACCGSLTKDGNVILALTLSVGQTVTCLPFCHWIMAPVTNPGPYSSE